MFLKQQERPQVQSANGLLRALLREAAGLRDDETAIATARRRRVWADILNFEFWAIRQQVVAAGYKRSGSAWVNESDIDDVVSDACIRATKMFEQFRGSTPGEFYNALSRCVQYAVIDYIRSDAARRENVVDPVAFEPGNGDHADSRLNELEQMVSASSAGDRAEFKEALSEIAELEPRSVTVLTMRMSGYRSSEIACELGLTAANVDQIFSRSIRVLMKRVNDD